MREQMEMHRASPACASCHKMMDPMGFAMENFDAIGQYRTMDGPNKLDFTGQLVDGGKFDGTSQLRQQLMRYSPRFVQALTERLLVYALGRGIDYADIPVRPWGCHARSVRQGKSLLRVDPGNRREPAVSNESSRGRKPRQR